MIQDTFGGKIILLGASRDVRYEGSTSVLTVAGLSYAEAERIVASLEGRPYLGPGASPEADPELAMPKPLFALVKSPPASSRQSELPFHAVPEKTAEKPVPEASAATPAPLAPTPKPTLDPAKVALYASANPAKPPPALNADGSEPKKRGRPRKNPEVPALKAREEEPAAEADESAPAEEGEEEWEDNGAGVQVPKGHQAKVAVTDHDAPAEEEDLVTPPVLTKAQAAAVFQDAGVVDGEEDDEAEEAPAPEPAPPPLPAELAAAKNLRDIVSYFLNRKGMSLKTDEGKAKIKAVVMRIKTRHPVLDKMPAENFETRIERAFVLLSEGEDEMRLS
jgi:hypothetical protein